MDYDDDASEDDNEGRGGKAEPLSNAVTSVPDGGGEGSASTGSDVGAAAGGDGGAPKVREAVRDVGDDNDDDSEGGRRPRLKQEEEEIGLDGGLKVRYRLLVWRSCKRARRYCEGFRAFWISRHLIPTPPPLPHTFTGRGPAGRAAGRWGRHGALLPGRAVVRGGEGGMDCGASHRVKGVGGGGGRGGRRRGRDVTCGFVTSPGTCIAPRCPHFVHPFSTLPVAKVEAARKDMSAGVTGDIRQLQQAATR